MSNPPPDDRDTLKALERLSAAANAPAKSGGAGQSSTPVRVATPVAANPAVPAGPVGQSRPVAPPPANGPAAKLPAAKAPVAPNLGAPMGPPLAPASAAPAGPVYRCLRCGYRLLPESGLRCSECGRQHTQQQMETWFSGAEQRRIELIIWRIGAGLFLRLWPIPQMLNLLWLPVLLLAPLGAAILAGWACGTVVKRPLDSARAKYALAGVLLAAGEFLWSLREFLNGSFLAGPEYTMTYVALDLMLAWLLFAALARPADGADVWGAARARWIAFIGLMATPVFAVCYTLLSNMTYVAGEIFGGGLPSGLLGSLLGHLVPYVVLVAVWAFLWHWFASFRRALFVPRER